MMSNTAPERVFGNATTNVGSDFSRRRPGRQTKKQTEKTPAPIGRPRQYEDVPSKYTISYSHTIIIITHLNTLLIFGILTNFFIFIC